MTKQPPDLDTYALTGAKSKATSAPDLDYQPPKPRRYSPGIGVIGAGGISAAHLDAYRTAGFDVRAVCDHTLSKAQERCDTYFPSAQATEDVSDLLDDDFIEILDITTHPADRVALIEQAIGAGKHLLSQKPFVLDLDTGRRLVAMADAAGVKLAVNQNGRWAPHFSYMREAVHTGCIGELLTSHTSVHWDHSWIKGTSFEDIDALIFYDFAIHWFDFLASLIGDRAQSVFASATRAAGQDVRPPLLAQCLVQFDGGQASLAFDALTRFGPEDRTFIVGTKGSLSSVGPNLGEQTVTITTEAGTASPDLVGTWFNDGFRGAMGELLCAIEEDREPLNGARDNLHSLALAFAAIESAKSNQPVALSDVA